MAQRVGILQTNRPVTIEEHREWSAKLWQRLDRDRSGTIREEELFCDEMQDVLRSILTPKLAGVTLATYGRSEQNQRQVVHYIMRMADTDRNGTLDYEEFDRFLRVFRSNSGNPDMIFTMFDLNNECHIDKEEFEGIFRFFLGRTPSEAELNKQWKRLNHHNETTVTRKRFIEWMKKTKDRHPAFRQRCAPVIGAEGDDLLKYDLGDGQLNRRKKGDIFRPAPGLLPKKNAHRAYQPPWNERWSSKDPSEQNLAWRGNQRAKTWFKQYDSLPELREFYATYRGFESHWKALTNPEVDDRKWPPSKPTDPVTGLGCRRKPKWKTGPGGDGPPVPRTIPILGYDSLLDLKAPGQTRHIEQGNQSEHPWRELTPRAHKVGKATSHGSLLLRCPGLPPQWLAVGRANAAEAALLTYEGSSSAARLRDGPLAGLRMTH